jgi:excisionase family DNA binding protein
MSNTQAPKFVNLATAAKMVGVGSSSVRGWILIGWLPAERDGWQWRINVEDLEKVNERSLAGAGAKQRGKRGQFFRKPGDDSVAEDAAGAVAAGD